tara:strand:+ start:940 stop:1401 length:462 start_codon:yes stop_codon:yes gene_type:complete
MAVPSSGALILMKIQNELLVNDYAGGNVYSNVSLKELCDGTVATINSSNNPSQNRPDGSPPHQMSEFYSYDHDAVKSDRRLKTNINLIGHSKSNIPIYTFNFKKYPKVSYHWEGVMAQDLLEMGLEDSVRIADDGYYVVNYDKIDVRFKKINN